MPKSEDPLLSQTVFHPVSIKVKEQVKQFQEMVESTDKVPYNLDQIITAQIDEPAHA